jgi:hypothetical protein
MRFSTNGGGTDECENATLPVAWYTGILSFGVNKVLQAFKNVKSDFDRSGPLESDLICKVGLMSGCPVLKIQKPAWTNDSMEELPNQTGIFFSIWQDEMGVKTNRLLYNVHALKLRTLRGYAITSRDFADEFRSAFQLQAKLWQNVSVAFGPLTLMQGWQHFEPSHAEQQVHLLIRQFEGIAPIIDDLLSKRCLNVQCPNAIPSRKP